MSTMLQYQEVLCLKQKYPYLKIIRTKEGHAPYGKIILVSTKYKIDDLRYTKQSLYGFSIHPSCEIIKREKGYLVRDFTTAWDIRGTHFDKFFDALEFWLTNRSSNYN